MHERTKRDTHSHNKLEIVEVYNEMIKSTIKANGKTATRLARLATLHWLWM